MVTRPDGLQSRARQRGQILALFAISLFVVVGMVAVVIDISWLWANSLRVQRAADAAALAGAVYLPGDVPRAYTTARAEATKNKYTDGLGGVTVTPQQAAENPRQLRVTIDAPVDTFFARLFGINSFAVSRSSRAEYALPVPMGSPLNYIGAYLFRTPGSSSGGDTGWRTANASLGASTGRWRASSGSGAAGMVNVVRSLDTTYAWTPTNGRQHVWWSYGLVGGSSPPLPPPPPGGSLTISGIEVRLSGAYTSASCPNTRIGVALSHNSGTAWATTAYTPYLGTSSSASYSLGSASSTAAWGSRSWSHPDFGDANFRVRLTAQKGCSTSSTQIRVNQIEIRITYQAGIPADLVGQPLVSSDGSTRLASQGFWLTAVSQGANKINGDAHLPKYDPRKSGLNAEYAPASFYNYVIDLAPGTTNGSVHVFDAPFCATDPSGLYGMGERWLSSDQSPISTFYTLYDTGGTLTNFADDTVVASSGDLFRNVQASDTYLGGPAPSGTTAECRAGVASGPADARYWHNRWWPIATGLSGTAGGRQLRLHVTTTELSSPSSQDDANGHNNFVVEARASGLAPKVYGLEALEAAYMLPAGASSEFYLAQVEGAHAGKTMVIEMYDAGDTGRLRADLEILEPTVTGWRPVEFSYSARLAASGAANCGSYGSSGTTSVRTNSGGARHFDGCWLTINVALPTGYTAPNPPGVAGAGWWKFRYTMTGNSDDGVSTDGVTLKVSIRGSPVHLVVGP